MNPITTEADYALEQRAIENFKTYRVPNDVKQRFQRDWITSVKRLGDKWTYAVHVQRIENPQ